MRHYLTVKSLLFLQDIILINAIIGDDLGKSMSNPMGSPMESVVLKSTFSFNFLPVASQTT